MIAVFLVGAVLAAVHHAEVVAHRVGEPFGSLILAVAVTVIEVALIVTLMVPVAARTPHAGPRHGVRRGDDQLQRHRRAGPAGRGAASPPRGLQPRGHRLRAGHGHHARLGDAGAARASPPARPGRSSRRRSSASPRCASLALYALFVFTQTVRHRDFFLPVEPPDDAIDGDGHADPPSNRRRAGPLGLLLVALVAVVGLRQGRVTLHRATASRPPASPRPSVGVVIALLVLLPESIAAVRAAARDDVQTSLNLAYGSAMASIGLTIPTIAVATIWLDDPLKLGLEPMQIVLLASPRSSRCSPSSPAAPSRSTAGCTWCCWRRSCSSRSSRSHRMGTSSTPAASSAARVCARSRPRPGCRSAP